jgi:hypothetical protein
MLKLVILIKKHVSHAEPDDFDHNTFIQGKKIIFLTTTRSSLAESSDFYHDTL